MPPRSSPSITSTTKRAKCLSGSHSSTDGGRRNAVRRSTSRKLLIAIKPPFGAKQWRDSSENQRRWVKSDRLIAHAVAGVGRRSVDDLGDKFGRARIAGVLGARGVHLVHERRIFGHAGDVPNVRRPTAELRLDRAGLDHLDLDAECPELVPQSLRQTFDREFG